MRSLPTVVAAVFVVGLLLAPATVAAVPSATAGAQADESTLDCSYPLTLTDGSGTEVTIEEEPERVVAAAPSDARTIFEIGAEDKLVGMPQITGIEDLDTEGIEDVSTNDGSVGVDDEKVVDLEPDVVIASSFVSADTVAQLRDLGITVYHFGNAATMDDVREHASVTGQLTGECAGATETVEWMDDRLAAVDNLTDDEDRPMAYYAMPNGYTALEGTFQHAILEAAGVQNLAAEVGVGEDGTVSAEDVVEADPDWIIYEDSHDEPPVADAVEATSAYQNERFVTVDANQMNQPTPDAVHAVEDIGETVAEEEEGNGNGSDATDDSEEPVPGFGAVAALAGLLGALAIGWRHR